MRVFVDASAWVPMALPRDQNAGRLEAALVSLRRDPTEFVTTNWTLYEALAVTQRASKRHAIDLHRRALRLSTLEFVSRDVEAEALRRFLDWGDKTASVVDHANALIATRSGCQAILSFDSDFIPLAAIEGLRLLR